jgi:hypothetical protein
MAGFVNLSRWLSRRPLLSVSEMSRCASRMCPALSVRLSRNLSRPCPVGNYAGTGQQLRPLRAELSRPAAPGSQPAQSLPPGLGSSLQDRPALSVGARPAHSADRSATACATDPALSALSEREADPWQRTARALRGSVGSLASVERRSA